MMLIIPLQAVPSQTVNVTLANQNCAIDVYQNAYGLFCDLYVSNTLVIGGVVCQNLNRVVRDLYLGFVGDLCFQDTQGTEDPYFTGLGAGGRFIFCYLTTTDLGGEG
jgi:hypothetical protein